MRIENWELRIGQIQYVNSQFPILNSHPTKTAPTDSAPDAESASPKAWAALSEGPLSGSSPRTVPKCDPHMLRCPAYVCGNSDRSICLRGYPGSGPESFLSEEAGAASAILQTRVRLHMANAAARIRPTAPAFATAERIAGISWSVKPG